MKNLGIGNKLLLAFGGIGLVLLVLAGFAIAQLGTVNGLMSMAVGDILPRVMVADEIDTALSDFRIAEGQHILAITPETMRAAEGNLDRQRATIERDYRTLSEQIRTPQGRALLEKFRTEWTIYQRQNRVLVTLSRQNRNAEALGVMRGRSEQLFNDVSETADKLATLQADVAVAADKEGDAAYATARGMLIGAVLFSFLALGMILILLVRQIARPVSAMTGALTALGQGQMDVEVPVEERRDEVGALATAMKQLRDQLAAAERAKAEQTALIVDSIGAGLSRLAEGDLVTRVEADLVGPFAKLKADFNAAATSLQGTVAQVAEAANGINNGAGDIRQASDDLSQRTEQQAASLEETAAAMDEITTTVRQTAERAGRADAAVRTVRTVAEQSGAVVRDAVAAMGGIERRSHEISEIISVIDGIAFQTNLLALNAGVEAARAGDAGRGFAVVASEVRALAQRSADAARDVKSRINASSEQVASGVTLVGKTGAALDDIIDKIGEVSRMVTEIAAAAEQQATGLQQVNTAVTEMDGVTQQNAAMVEEATAAARSLAAEADGLTQQIARFRTGDTRVATAAAIAAVRRPQDRPAPPARRAGKSAPRTAGNAALAESWSEF